MTILQQMQENTKLILLEVTITTIRGRGIIHTQIVPHLRVMEM